MKKKIFARIIELPNNQVLLEKVTTDNEAAPVALRVTADIDTTSVKDQPDSRRISANMGFTEQAHVDDAFSSFAFKDAEEIVDNMKLQLGVEEEDGAEDAVIITD